MLKPLQFTLPFHHFRGWWLVGGGGCLFNEIVDIRMCFVGKALLMGNCSVYVLLPMLETDRLTDWQTGRSFVFLLLLDRILALLHLHLLLCCVQIEIYKNVYLFSYHHNHHLISIILDVPLKSGPHKCQFKYSINSKKCGRKRKNGKRKRVNIERCVVRSFKYYNNLILRRG